MKRIKYIATYQTPSQVVKDSYTVTARDINSGFLKAARLALRGLPATFEIHSVEFAEVL